MKYLSTRNKDIVVNGLQAIVDGLAKDGGLYVPSSFPQIGEQEFRLLADMTYPERAAFIIDKFVPEIGYDSLLVSTNAAYSKFDGDPTPVVKINDKVCMLELWHGPTHAFKDIALTVLPYLMVKSKKLLGLGEKTLILVATSGDTGKAALEGFKDIEGTDIIVLYPEEGVSALQKLQMMTQSGKNVYVAAIKGNFDDAQNAVKKIFTDKEIATKLAAKDYKLSSANSINWGRLVPQIAYYFSSYLDMVNGEEIKIGDKVNFCVPCGNFGNILAGYYALKMGLPINKLICASNINNVLTEFFNSGKYTIDREFHKTISPSMDILISSNLERLIFELSGRNDILTLERMQDLKKMGYYDISGEERNELSKIFFAGFADEDMVKWTLNQMFEEVGYIADPHTSVAISVYNDYVAQTKDETKTVIISTASPYKFVKDVLRALEEVAPASEMACLTALEDVTALPIPDSLSELTKLKKIYTDVIKKDEVSGTVLNYIYKK